MRLGGINRTHKCLLHSGLRPERVILRPFSFEDTSVAIKVDYCDEQGCSRLRLGRAGLLRNEITDMLVSKNASIAMLELHVEALAAAMGLETVCCSDDDFVINHSCSVNLASALFDTELLCASGKQVKGASTFVVQQ